MTWIYSIFKNEELHFVGMGHTSMSKNWVLIWKIHLLNSHTVQGIVGDRFSVKSILWGILYHHNIYSIWDGLLFFFAMLVVQNQNCVEKTSTNSLGIKIKLSWNCLALFFKHLRWPYINSKKPPPSQILKVFDTLVLQAVSQSKCEM